MAQSRESAIVRLPNDVLERNDVTCSRGPLGIQLNQISSGIVVLTSFLPLPNGSKGEIERSGLVRPGDALLCINEVPIEFEAYGNVLQTLKGEFPLTLTFGRTSEELAREVREDFIRRALKVRETEDRKRLQELEAARAQREKEQRRQLAKTAQGSQFERVNVVRSQDSDRSTRIEIKSMPTFSAPPVYTAKDFKTARFTTFQKQVAVILVMMALFRATWTFSKQPTLADVVPVEGEFIITNKHKEVTADAVRKDLQGSNKVWHNATGILIHHSRGSAHKKATRRKRTAKLVETEEGEHSSEQPKKQVPVLSGTAPETKPLGGPAQGGTSNEIAERSSESSSNTTLAA